MENDSAKLKIPSRFLWLKIGIAFAAIDALFLVITAIAEHSFQEGLIWFSLVNIFAVMLLDSLPYLGFYNDILLIFLGVIISFGIGAIIGRLIQLRKFTFLVILILLFILVYYIIFRGYID